MSLGIRSVSGYEESSFDGSLKRHWNGRGKPVPHSVGLQEFRIDFIEGKR